MHLSYPSTQAKAMGGDSAVRSLLEKMTEYASAAYLRMLERFMIVHSFFPCLSLLAFTFKLKSILNTHPLIIVMSCLES